jgi:hypothetical protein
VVRSFTGREFVFDAAGLADGIYVAKAVTAGGVSCRRLLLQR